jgi:hypothetical protein
MVPDFHDSNLGRGADHVERLLLVFHSPQLWPVVLQDPDPISLAAALEGRPEWSGLSAEMRADVERAYVKMPRLASAEIAPNTVPMMCAPK